MHWAERIAEALIHQHPSREEFHFASGTTPSGPVHCGNLRDILTNWYVAQCLVERGKKVKLLQSWDDYDRFRKVPKGIPEEFSAHLGKPVADVPDPGDEYPSYAARYEKIFERSLTQLAIPLEYRYQAQMYREARYNAGIVEAISKRKQIFDILNDFRTEKGTDADREAYYVVEVYCPNCKRDTTKMTHFDEATMDFAYRCKCGNEGSGNAHTATNLKLPWKVDWPMRWRHEEVIFEPGGKDHGTAGGSYEVACRISREVFNHEPPMFQVYEFVGIKGTVGKMSGSTGSVITLDEALEIYQPEVLLWVFARLAPNRAFDLVLDRQIFQTYDEYDRAAAAPVSEDVERKAVDLSHVGDRRVYPVSFRQLASFSGIVRGNRAAMESILTRTGTPSPQAEFTERLTKAENWLKKWAPEEDVRLVDAPRADYAASLTPERREWIAKLAAWIDATDITLENATERLYAIPQEGSDGSDQKARQKAFFTDIYQLLFARSAGPRLGTFLAAVPKSDYRKLLDA